MSDNDPVKPLPSLAHDLWAGLDSLGAIKGWLQTYVNPKLYVALMGQLDAIYLHLNELGLREVVTATGFRPTMTRDGFVTKYVLVVNYIHDGTNHEYLTLMKPDMTGYVIEYTTQHGSPAKDLHNGNDAIR